MWLLLILFLLIPFMLFGYDPITQPPEDMGQFISWFMNNVGGVGAHGANYVIAFICTVLIGILKSITPLKPIWDRLGKWKMTIPIILGAIGEVALNFPSPFAWSGFFQMLIVGATGAGAVSIALHHVWAGLFSPKVPV